MHVTRITTEADRTAAFAIRRVVFIEEQHVDPALEYDDDDARAVHFLARDAAGMAVGTARVVLESGFARLGRMAVLASHRRLGVGRALAEACLTFIRETGRREARLHAQTHALPFYEALGFRAEGDIFDEAGIPHRAMRRVL